MAFDFLANLPAIADAVSGVSGAILNFRGRDPYDEIETLQPYVNALEASRVYQAAALNPADPYNKNLSNIFEDKIRRDFIESIRDLERRNRRSQIRGVVGPRLNPERRDEGIAAGLAQNRVDAGLQARLLASQKLTEAASGERGRAGALAQSFPAFQQYGQLNREGLTGGIEGLGKLVGSPDFGQLLQSIFGGGANTGIIPSGGGRVRQAPSGQQRGFAHGLFGGGV